MQTLNLRVPETQLWGTLKTRILPFPSDAEKMIVQEIAQLGLLSYKDYNNQNLTISEVLLAKIIGMLLMHKCSSMQILHLAMILTAKYTDIDSEDKNTQVVEEWRNRSIFLDGLIQYIVKSQKDILLDLYPNGELGFNYSTGKLIDDTSKPTGTPLISISIFNVVASIVGTKNLPPLKSSIAVIEPEETELILALKEECWDTITLTAIGKRVKWKLECTKYGQATTAEITSMQKQVEGTPHSVNTTGSPNSRKSNYAYIWRKRIS